MMPYSNVLTLFHFIRSYIQTKRVKLDCYEEECFLGTTYSDVCNSFIYLCTS